MNKCYILIPGILLPLMVLAQSPSFTKLPASSGLRVTTDARGVSLADFDRDGLMDIFVAQNGRANRLFRNLGNLQFADVAQEAGLTAGGSNRAGVWADYDNDGFPDLFVGGMAAYHLYHNLGNGKFEEVSAPAGIAASPNANGAMWADVENNAHVDLYTTNLNSPNTFFLNRGNATFRDAIAATGLLDPQEPSMGGAFGDYDNDGDLDLYLVHDAHNPFRLYRNAGYGYFTEVAREARVNFAADGMGTTFADFDNDGWLDIYVTNLDSNVIFFNNSDGTFSNTTAYSGVGDRGMGWGIVALDYDNDTWQDLYVVNAAGFPPLYLGNVLYRNLGNRKFVNVTSAAGVASERDGWGGAAGDLNNDGSQDLLVTNWNGECLQVFINNGGAGNYLKIGLTGTRCNRYAIGARVRMVVNGAQQIRELSGGAGYLSQDSPILHFGLAQAAKVDTLEIYWPGGGREHYFNLAANQQVNYIEGQATGVDEPRTQVPASLKLHPSFPNPFHLNTADRAAAEIRFELPAAATVEVAVYDLQGRRVVTLAHRLFGAGAQRVAWNGRDAWQKPVSAGVYLLHLNSGAQHLRQKITLVR